ncbi:MAG: hypothetical protein QOF08_2169, partial [Gaiellales bacterium]|nr:hypothetical protein [Gaiellales bacterium]
LDLLRALAVPHSFRPPGLPPRDLSPAARHLIAGLKPPVLAYPQIVTAVLEWLVVLQPVEGGSGFLLDAAESQLASMPRPAAREATPHGFIGWRNSEWVMYLRLARTLRRLRPDLWSGAEQGRLWALERWLEQGAESRVRRGLRKMWTGQIETPIRVRPPTEELVAAFVASAATEGDVVDHMVGDRPTVGWGSAFNSLGDLTRKSVRDGLDARLGEIVDRVRRRVVDVELRRGEAPTAASRAALAIRDSGGLGVLMRLLTALGRDGFVRGWSYDGEARSVVFSRLIRATSPREGDAPDLFAAAVASAGIADKRLIELAMFAPQWARHVERAVGWPGLASAIWWFHAHTKDTSWTVDQDVRAVWAAEVSERTPLASQDLMDGAVDVEWFGDVYAATGGERWKALDAAAKYCSTGGGHKRAQLFADAMRGKGDEQALQRRIDEKRHQDSVRALGLLPTPEGEQHDQAVLGRYQAMHEFIRSSRQFGSQRQASERRAAEIGLENLSRSAGYADPIRLGWAMEARGAADLAEGVVVERDGVVVRLSIDADGNPDLSVRRADKPLKTVPASLRKDEQVAELRSRATALRRQAGRIRGSLEEAMNRGDGFSGAELYDLTRHPTLWPRLSRLVLVGEGPTGYPDGDGRALRDAGGAMHAIGSGETLRIAHPVDLLADGAWHEWQRDAFVRGLVQPFKQLFRELYVPTADELAGDGGTRRYAGHQLQPRKALAVLGGRGWVHHPEEGVRRTFHRESLTAVLVFLEGFATPAEVEGLTLEEVRFFRLGTGDPVVIADLPPRLFSEAMRDLDLAVSVAHAGGVDPEASASTVEMRAALIEETCGLLKIENVRIDAPWVLIDGRLGEYSVHLGSASVHRRPGGAVCIIPVHSQHRGRLFLPFVDDDPKTAEVVSKMLLLARDDEIKDPT